MLEKRILETDAEFETYQEKFIRSLGPTRTQKIPRDYFRRSHVVGLFDGTGEMVVGYMLGQAQPFRLLEFVPRPGQLSLPGGFGWERCQEIVCVWKEKSVPKRLTLKHLWPNIMADFLASGKPFLLGHTQSEKLYQHYDQMGPKTLYEGPSVFDLPSRLFFYTRFQCRAIRALSLTLAFFYVRFKR